MSASLTSLWSTLIIVYLSSIWILFLCSENTVPHMSWWEAEPTFQYWPENANYVYGGCSMLVHSTSILMGLYIVFLYFRT